MKVAFMGTPLFAQIVFEALCKYCDVVLVCTQPDKPTGRKQMLAPPPMKRAALAMGVPFLQPSTLDSSVCKQIASYQPDVIVVVAYGKILPESLLSLAPCINLHASILPKYRGASPIQQMILSDDEEYGVSVILMNSTLDGGDILGIASMPRDNRATYTIICQKLAMLGAKALCDVLDHMDEITPIAQDDSKASYCKKICKADGLVDFTNAQMVYKKWLAFCEWPGVFLASGVKLFDVEILKGLDEIGMQNISKHNLARYESLDTSDVLGDDSLKGGDKRAHVEARYKEGEICCVCPCIIACSDGGFLRIGALQAPSKNRLEASDFLRSRKLNVGDVLC